MHESFGFLSVVPPILTIILSILTRNVILSLGLGAFSGMLILSHYNPFQATLSLISEQIFQQIASPSNNQVLIVIVCIGGFVKLLDASGGAQAFAKKMTKYISTPGQAQFFTWVCGIGIFFTDSGNSLILGPLFRPIYEKLGICKEKLAWILDATSAPICILIPFISWGAYIMSLLEVTYANMGISANPLTTLVSAMPYQFYALLTLFSVPVIALMGKDYGPMAKAQENYTAAPVSHDHNPEAEVELEGETSTWAIIIPLTILVGFIAFLMSYFFMSAAGLTSVNIRTSLLVSYIAASIGSAIFMKVMYQRTFNHTLGLFIQGAEKMIFIVFILILAWSLSSICKDLHTGDYIASIMKSFVTTNFFPLIVFILGALISLSTGSSYGTFAILMPIALPVALELGTPLLVTIGAVLSGGLFGDHTSPISDTTVLSSMGAECDHICHVNTQMIYSLLTGSVCAISFVIAAMTENPITIAIGFTIQIILIFLVMKKWGKKTIINL